jgi:ribosome modulation factor
LELKQDLLAWQEGYDAGLKLDDRYCPYCPYPAGSAETWSWSSGWIEGRAERLARELVED